MIEVGPHYSFESDNCPGGWYYHFGAFAQTGSQGAGGPSLDRLSPICIESRYSAMRHKSTQKKELSW